MFNQKLQAMDSGDSTKSAGPQAPGELRRLPLLSPLSDAQLATVFEGLQIHTLRPRQSISYIRELQGRCGFVWSGSMRIVAHTPSGVAVTVGEIPKGEACGFAFAILDYEPNETLRLVADAPATLISTNGPALMEYALENRDYAKAVISHFALHATRLSSRLFELAAYDVRTRLQGEILRLCGDTGDARSHIINPAPKQATLAAQIGATREAVTRHLKEMEEDGLIEFRRGVIAVTRLDKLRQITPAPSGQHLFRPRADLRGGS